MGLEDLQQLLFLQFRQDLDQNGRDVFDQDVLEVIVEELEGTDDELGVLGEGGLVVADVDELLGHELHILEQGEHHALVVLFLQTRLYHPVDSSQQQVDVRVVRVHGEQNQLEVVDDAALRLDVQQELGDLVEDVFQEGGVVG